MKIIRNNPGPYRKKKKKKPFIQKIILDNFIRIPMPYSLESEIQKNFTILNPDFLKEVRRRRLSKLDWPSCGFLEIKEKINGKWNTRRIYQRYFLWKYDGSDLVVPRGCFQQIRSIFKRNSEPFELVNNWRLEPEIQIPFKSKLMDEKGQLPFINWKSHNGMLISGTGSGKTVMALFQAKRFKQPTLIVVDTYELQKQWINRITDHCDIKKTQIGMIGGGKQIIKPITVGLIQTLSKHPELTEHFGFLITDEVHETSDRYYKVMEYYNGAYSLGLTATPKDGPVGRIQQAYFGPIAMKLDKSKAEKLPATGIFVHTDYRSFIPFKYKYSKALAVMLADEKRNQRIVDNILKHIDIYGIHLVISRSSKQLDALHSMLPDHIKLIARVITGKVSKKERREIVHKAMNNELKFLFATDKILEKGFDEELLSVLHIASPKAGEDKIEQGCGRVRRVPKKDHQEVREKKKHVFIFYYYDYQELSLRGAASAVSRVFAKLGIPKQILKE